MSREGHDPATTGMRQWPILHAPRSFVAYILAVDLVAFLWSLTDVARMGTSPRQWGVLGLLCLIALIFEESARRSARLQLRLSSDMKRDMTSVWCIAAAVALAPGFAVLLLGVVLTYVWFRQQRPAGEVLHRKTFNAATVLLGALGAGALVRAASHLWHDTPWMLDGAISVVVAIVAYTLINRALVTACLLIMGLRGRALMGGADDNLIEIATLCLGGLVALAVLYQPWLSILVLAPMVTLQRGALVRELETAATVDSKTGLLNAVAWEHLASRELLRAGRAEKPVAILIIDIDRFKSVNDRFGHLAGDAVLRGVGRCLAAQVREYDTVGRFGGEEFVAVLPEATQVEALIVAERMRSKVNELRVSG
ncbi:MAG: GGDEF domain-containing protein, partial [Actinobacteria bacterium]|nr:GGDEF domain-containing protein [Actinomycetota bacterium]